MTETPEICTRLQAFCPGVRLEVEAPAGAEPADAEAGDAAPEVENADEYEDPDMKPRPNVRQLMPRAL